ncbi:MAG: DUF1491 family protein, partial [Hyphomicrobiaceae bacterium]
GLNDEETPDRRWIRRPAAPESEIDTYLARQKSFDPDLWIVELEDRMERHGLEGWLAAPSG